MGESLFEVRDVVFLLIFFAAIVFAVGVFIGWVFL